MNREATVEWSDSLLINGQRVRGDGPERQVFDPATEEVLTTVHDATTDQLESAIAAARWAFDSGVWGDAAERAMWLRRLGDVVEARSDEIVAATAFEAGLPVSLGRALQVATVDLLRWFADATLVDRTEELGVSSKPFPSQSRVCYQPIGVVAAITAYNSPLLPAVNKIGAALAAGCTAVLLPSGLAPLTSLLLADMLGELEFPAGVINVVVGGEEIGRYLTTHRAVDKVTFTGSVAVGRAIMQQAAQGIKDVVLELGGKSPGLVLPGVDLAPIIVGLHSRYLRNAGQGCQAPTRLLVHENQVDEFIELTRDAFPQIKVGDPFEEETVVGPLIRPAHRDRVERYIASVEEEGGKILAGGGRPPIERGWYVNSTLFGNLPNSATACREEIFGPVAALLPYHDVDHAVEIANDSDYGLAAHLFGPSDECLAVAPRLRAGTIVINGGGGLRADAPMGGFKMSGIGREYGEWGVQEFLLTQHIQWKLD